MVLGDILQYHLDESNNQKKSKRHRKKHKEMYEYLVLLVDAITVLQQPR